MNISYASKKCRGSEKNLYINHFIKCLTNSKQPDMNIFLYWQQCMSKLACSER